jgi:predicted GIY-YIG superfamily endonuclease
MDFEYIYVIESEETGLFKIGTTQDYMRRFYQLQKTSAYPLSIFALMHCPEGLGRYFEKKLHQKFKNKRTHGEWFKLSVDDLRWFTLRAKVLSAEVSLLLMVSEESKEYHIQDTERFLLKEESIRLEEEAKEEMRKRREELASMGII